MKKLLSTIGVIIALSGFISLCWGIDNYFAHKQEVLALHQEHEADLASVSNRLELKIDSDRAKNLEERIWNIEKYYKKSTMPEPVYKDYLEKKKELQDLNNKMKK